MELENFLKQFGRQLKMTRKQMGLSQVTAAQNMRIDYRHYQNIEGGKINLRLDTMIKLVRFYDLDKSGRPFNIETCMNLLTENKAPSSDESWNLLFEHFVECGHAGFLTFNSTSHVVDNANAKLLDLLGVSGAAEVTGKPVLNLIDAENVRPIMDHLTKVAAETASKPFILNLRHKSPSSTIPVMAVVKVTEDERSGEEVVQCIFFDRKTLEDEGHRLNELLHGYQQFMELYPQLKAV